MTIARTLQDYLDQRGVQYRPVRHPHSESSMETAETAHVAGDAVAKGVVLRDKDGVLLVVVPSDYHVELDRLNRQLERQLALVPEGTLKELFPDCELGAVPPLGAAYGLDTAWDPDTGLGDRTDVYLEAGDHETLVQISGTQFHALMADAQQARFGQHV